MATAEEIIEQVRTLPIEHRQRLRAVLDEVEREERLQLLKTIQEKYKGCLSSSEEFAKHKAEEIALEDRHMGHLLK